MIAKILISASSKIRHEQIQSDLLAVNLSFNHPDVLFLEEDSKLGVLQAKKIREHLSLKPFSSQGRAVVIANLSEMTIEAQNSLLKTFEEPPENAVLIFGAKGESGILETIRSRCQIVYLDEKNDTKTGVGDFSKDIERLAQQTMEERFRFIENLEAKEQFLNELLVYYRGKLKDQPGSVEFTKKLLKSSEWADQNVNIRAILEYLMLCMPEN